MRMRWMAPVVRIPIALSGVVGRAEHGEVADLQREIGTGPAALHVIDGQVLAGRKLMLVSAAQFASAIVRAQRIIAKPPPLRGAGKGGRRDEPRRPTLRVT